MYDHAEKVLERKWRTYFGPSSTLSTSLRHVPFTSSTSPALKGLGSSKHYRSSISSSRPASVDISGKISEQKRWVEEFSKSLPHRAVSGAF
ncbi:hypothetical protein EB796_005297 [Bugula neritina]|nr:hypothetical protein EB796_005297 [Bugula neritina]